MQSNKQNFDPYFPAIVKDQNFEELFFHNNKFIVYDFKDDQKQKINCLQAKLNKRPQTGISINNKLINRIGHSNKSSQIFKSFKSSKKTFQSIDSNFRPQAKYMLNRKYQNINTPQIKINNNRFNQNQNNRQILDNQQYMTKDYSLFNKQNQKIINQLSIQRNKSGTNIIKRQSKQINRNNTFRGSKKKDTNISKNNILKQQISQVEAAKELQNNTNIEPQASAIESKEKGESIPAQPQQIQICQHKYYSLFQLFNSNDKFMNKCSQIYQGLQEYQLCQNSVLPINCYITSSNFKKMTFYHNQISQLQKKIQQQKQQIMIKDKQIKEIKQIYCNSNEINTDMVNLQSCEIQGMNKQINYRQGQKSTQREQNLTQKQKRIMNQIDILNKTIKNENQFINKNDKRNSQRKSNNLIDKNTKKIVLNSKFHQKQYRIQVSNDCLKRSILTNYLNKEYYQKLMQIYWALISQNPQKIKENPDKKSIDKCQPQLKYSFSDKKKTTTYQKNFKNYEKNDQTYFIDSQFPHQSIQIPHQKQIHWIYFQPTPQSALFPTQLKLPDHFVLTQYILQNNNKCSLKNPIPLIKLLNCLLIINPDLISRIFEPCYANIFSCWLFIKNHFEPVYIDGYLPYNGKLNTIYGWNDQYLWIGILMKSIAKVLGNYKKIQSLKLQECYKLITGKNFIKIKKPQITQCQDKQIKDFTQYFKDLFQKEKYKNQSEILLRNIKNDQIYIIKQLDSDIVKLIKCCPLMKKIQITFQYLLNASHIQIIIFPKSSDLYYNTSEYQSNKNGSITTYQLIVKQDKTHFILRNEINLEETQKNTKIKNNTVCDRRVIIYEMPHSFKSSKKKPKQMILKYSSMSQDTSRLIKIKQNNQILQFLIPEMKKGVYKVFIQCGNIKLKSYFSNKDYSIHRSIHKKVLSQSQDYLDEQDSSKSQVQKNILTIISDKLVILKGGSLLVENTPSNINENQKMALQDNELRYYKIEQNQRKKHKFQKRFEEDP